MTMNDNGGRWMSLILIFQTTLKWKAALLNKRRERAKPVLSDEDVELLVKNTYFSEHDIR